MFDAVLNNPAIVKAAAKVAGIQAGRLDYDQAADRLVASLKIHGRIVQHEIPMGRTFTTEQILTLLFDDPAAAHGQKEPAALSGSTGRSPP